MFPVRFPIGPLSQWDIWVSAGLKWGSYDCYYVVVVKAHGLEKRPGFFSIDSSDFSAHSILACDRFVIKIARIGWYEIRKSSNALRDSISAFWFISWHSERSQKNRFSCRAVRFKITIKNYLCSIRLSFWIDLNDLCPIWIIENGY